LTAAVAINLSCFLSGLLIVFEPRLRKAARQLIVDGDLAELSMECVTC